MFMLFTSMVMCALMIGLFSSNVMAEELISSKTEVIKVKEYDGYDKNLRYKQKQIVDRDVKYCYTRYNRDYSTYYKKCIYEYKYKITSYYDITLKYNVYDKIYKNNTYVATSSGKPMVQHVLLNEGLLTWDHLKGVKYYKVFEVYPNGSFKLYQTTNDNRIMVRDPFGKYAVAPVFYDGHTGVPVGEHFILDNTLKYTVKEYVGKELVDVETRSYTKTEVNYYTITKY